jgi:hypothetical protein
LGRNLLGDRAFFPGAIWYYAGISSRSINVGALMMQHMDWENDCLKIIICKHKGDATSKGLRNMKHVYVNPYNPDVCPILSLALLTFCKQRRANINVQQVFEGDKSENRFLQILKNVIDHKPVDTNLGASKRDLGSHSNRKGAISFVLSFAVISAVCVYLRAGWSLGNVQDRYIFAGAGGDQTVGREFVVCL